MLNQPTPSPKLLSHQRPRRFFPRAATLSCLLAFFVLPTLAQQTRVPQRTPLERRVIAIVGEEAARQSHWGVEVVSVETGKRLAAINSEKRFIPASTGKLFIAAAALSRLGPDFKYRTTVETATAVSEDGRVPGDLVLVGHGDPNLSARVLPYNGRTERTQAPTLALEELADQVARRGIRIVDGDLVVDDMYFVFQPYGQGWTLDDLQWGYGAPVAALAINDNVFVIHMEPGARAGDPARIRLVPASTHFQLDNHIVTISREQKTTTAGRRLTIDRQPGSSVVRLWGEIPEGGPERLEALAMDNPPLVAGEVFRDALSRHGITVRGTVRVREQYPGEVADLERGESPSPSPPATVLAARESLPLAESLKVILKVSQNLHAEMLLRTLGRERRRIGSVEAGLAEVGEFLKEIGVVNEDVALRDGSGLSRQSLVTPSAMTALLRAMYNTPHRDLWMNLLPVAGTDGSLQNRLRGRTVVGRVRAKTGALAGVAALAGYAPNRNGELLAFTIFVNHHNLPNGEVVGLVDRIAAEIAASQ